MKTLTEIKELLIKNSSKFLGTIPYDKSVTEAQVKGLSVIEYADNQVTDSIKQIWQEIRGKVITK